MPGPACAFRRRPGVKVKTPSIPFATGIAWRNETGELAIARGRCDTRSQGDDMQQDPFDPATIMGAIYGNGITALPAAFPQAWADELHVDLAGLFEEALQQPGGAVGRGPNRYYVEIHPERIRG